MNPPLSTIASPSGASHHDGLGSPDQTKQCVWLKIRRQTKTDIPCTTLDIPHITTPTARHDRCQPHVIWHEFHRSRWHDEEPTW